jgi:hypothetical protein
MSIIKCSQQIGLLEHATCPEPSSAAVIAAMSYTMAVHVRSIALSTSDGGYLKCNASKALPSIGIIHCRTMQMHCVSSGPNNARLEFSRRQAIRLGRPPNVAFPRALTIPCHCCSYLLVPRAAFDS